MNIDEIKYESVVYPSLARTGLSAALRNCPIGMSFEWRCSGADSIHPIARRLGFKIKTSSKDKDGESLPPNTFRVWRLS